MCFKPKTKTTAQNKNENIKISRVQKMRPFYTYRSTRIRVQALIHTYTYIQYLHILYKCVCVYSALQQTHVHFFSKYINGYSVARLHTLHNITLTRQRACDRTLQTNRALGCVCAQDRNHLRLCFAAHPPPCVRTPLPTNM